MKTQKDQAVAQNYALSSTLSARQLNEQKMYQYARRLETAIQEQSVFPQIQCRIDELSQEDNNDPAFRKREEEHLAKNIKIDDLERQIIKQKLEKEALQGELNETTTLVTDKEEQL